MVKKYKEYTKEEFDDWFDNNSLEDELRKPIWNLIRNCGVRFELKQQEQELAELVIRLKLEVK